MRLDLEEAADQAATGWKEVLRRGQGDLELRLLGERSRQLELDRGSRDEIVVRLMAGIVDGETFTAESILCATRGLRIALTR